MSGEPVANLEGERIEVFAGTINQKGISVRGEQDRQRDGAMQTIRRVEEAQGPRTLRAEAGGSDVGIFVLSVMLTALLSFAIWMDDRRFGRLHPWSACFGHGALSSPVRVHYWLR